MYYVIPMGKYRTQAILVVEVPVWFTDGLIYLMILMVLPWSARPVPRLKEEALH